MTTVREEQPDDGLIVRKINEMAFGGPTEARIVERLRQNCPDVLSLVACVEDKIVGHVLFSPVELQSEKKSIEGMGLGPMAVLPEFQRKGVGTALIQTGITKLRILGCPFVVVLGHSGYYPKFGFERASLYGIRSRWDVPDDVFMVLILDEPAMDEIWGVAHYREEFDETV
jgi:putative acetyltransferase